MCLVDSTKVKSKLNQSLNSGVSLGNLKSSVTKGKLKSKLQGEGLKDIAKDWAGKKNVVVSTPAIIGNPPQPSVNQAYNPRRLSLISSNLARNTVKQTFGE